MDNNEDLILAKIVSMTVLGLASFLLGLLPLKLTKISTFQSLDGGKNLLLSLLLCFGGGVLLFTTFIHLQPEVREFFDHLKAHGKVTDWGVPLSELVFCLGFFFVYLIEELVHAVLDRKGHQEHAALHRSLSIRCSSRKPSENLTIPRVTLTTNSYITSSNKDLIDTENPNNNHHNSNESIKNSFSGFLAVLALSFHAVFEGLAVGLEGGVQKVWYLLAAIATHKLVIAFCVGIELATSKTKSMLVVLYIGTFAVVTPLGIGIGIVISDLGDNQENVACVVLQGMAAGTLLYVVFFEVLARERDNRHSGIWQLMAILLGFLVMFALQILTGHQHSHEHHHDHHHIEVTTHLH